MKTGLIVLGVIILIVIGGIGWAIGINNQLVTQEQAVGEKWAQVQNVYQRRADLIPNLVETVKGYAAQERTVLEEVTKARASVAGIKATPELVNDPEAFRKFQAAQQEGTENRIAVERMRYSEAVRDYNTRLRLFPGSLVASLRGFKEKAYFEAAPGSQEAPKVKF
jgi:LemA protein